MAGRNQKQQQKMMMKHTFRLFSGETGNPTATATGGAADEFDESEIWGLSFDTKEAEDPTYYGKNKKPMALARGRKASSNGERKPPAASSLPVNIPDWSKILGEEYSSNNSNNGGEVDDWDEDDDEEEMGGGRVLIPPHEYLFQRRRRGVAASFSVHEGVGRTLKGRDLSRVRNAIWEKIGFQD